MRVQADREACIQAGNCVMVAADVFDQDDAVWVRTTDFGDGLSIDYIRVYELASDPDRNDAIQDGGYDCQLIDRSDAQNHAPLCECAARQFHAAKYATLSVVEHMLFPILYNMHLDNTF